MPSDTRGNSPARNTSYMKKSSAGKQESLSNQLLSRGDTMLDNSNFKLDLQIMDNAYEKWLREEDSLQGVLNVKMIKAKNTDFKQKIDAWKRRVDERRRVKKRA
jgi:hypothetical protein